ncbi:hypothetical protein MUN81_17110 [Hymenobacter sp. 5317J-9]|uniref:hypothetical protein n=1 Tax=Hymenobacter sp. 5317J-9 TaxID=2932250 RepID=UPI001FD6E83F|nr:hypothetical protein [Hymenobacter sp. 5317J-9]UOQ96951.1 hypothetical protein MUN81_17110 [Hymenobacter sp. 5317J-9]
MLTKEQLNALSMALMHTMQASIVIPMAVVWLRRKHFLPTVKLLSNYVYISTFFVVAMTVLYPAYLSTNWWLLAGFNCCKVGLFWAVYRQVLDAAWQRRLLGVASAFMVLSTVGLYWYNGALGVAYARIMQCALLAAVAMAYLEQKMSRAPTLRLWHDPLWLLSVGQLVYSAGTVTAFSQDYLTVTIYDQTWKYVMVALSGLAFNWFLTLAFLRAKRELLAPAQPSSQLATY